MIALRTAPLLLLCASAACPAPSTSTAGVDRMTLSTPTDAANSSDLRSTLDSAAGDQARPDQNEASDQAAVDSFLAEDVVSSTDSSQPEDAGQPGTRALTVLTYNVAGLPFGLSDSSPEVNTALISPLLNDFELVLVQENFAWHDDLRAQTTHAYQSEPMPGSLEQRLGDGLNRFSVYPFVDFARVEWTACNGILGSAADCLTPKGFTFARHTLAPGLEVDIYNVHLDAGRDDKDAAARSAQVDQLLAFMQLRSADRAVILGGDLNLKNHGEDEVILQRLLSSAGLTDACHQQSCVDPSNYDRVLLRDNTLLELQIRSWNFAPGFVDGAGEPLSDHAPVLVELGW